MARITVEDCLEKVDNQYDLVLLAKERTVQLNAGSPMLVEEDNDKRTIISLREIGDGKIEVKDIEASAIKRLRKEPDELEVTIVETSPFVLELSTVTGGTPGYTYTWNESGNNVGTGTSYVVSSNGTYSLEATDANNCTSTSNSITYNVASVINGEEVSFRVYPNPASSEINIQSNVQIEKIELINIQGQNILETKQSQLNIEGIPNGIYFVRVNDIHGPFKIIKRANTVSIIDGLHLKMLFVYLLIFLHLLVIFQ